MLKQSAITIETQSYIQEKINEVANKHNVRILFAVESGSRAWGFPSKNSDYDVRFVYARSRNDYLSIKNYRDVIETDILNDNYLKVPLDLNGWDIRKALQLAINSNAVLIEWLLSPIKYIIEKKSINLIYQFANDVADIESIKKHYYKQTTNTWKQIEQTENEVKIKLYCYTIRTSLALQWVLNFEKAPPMDMYSLMKRLNIKQKLATEIYKLMNIKTTSQESNIITRNSTLDEFIQSTLTNLPRNKDYLEDKKKIQKADELFRKIVL
nr:nucleotidyltransferase domain-containing protein [Rickettsia endosymbiont of Ceutorhynchus assimilis]